MNEHARIRIADKTPDLEPKMLTREEVYALVNRYKQNGDIEARNKLVLSHQPLVRSVAQRYRSHNMNLEELMQIGNEGLIAAIDRFETVKGFALATYAYSSINETIKDAVSRDRIVHIPRRPLEVERRQKSRADRGIVGGTGNIPPYALLRALNLGVGGAGRQAGEASQKDTVQASELRDQSAEDAFVNAENALTLEGYEKYLTPREHRVIRGLYFEGKTKTEIGEIEGSNKQTIANVEDRALDKLRAALHGKE
ncbi:MAG: sigma-70 family RNA polymerase sigma factor [Patescibacteria group bacterium]